VDEIDTMKRLFIIHGWSGFPEECWFPWLKTEAEKLGFMVQVPAMPHPDEPTIKDWVAHLTVTIGTPDTETFLVGHSIGCQTILRYLDNLPEGQRVGGIVCVAGFFELTNLDTEEENRIFKPWLETPIHDERVRSRAGKIVGIFSDNDHYVPFEKSRNAYEQRLGAETVAEHGKGHMGNSDHCEELPSVLEALQRVSL
jgi:uncharacterized protein